MSEEYDKERTAALIKKAREMMAHLKVEAGEIKMQMESVLEGDDDEGGEKAADEPSILESVVPRKSFWRRWV